MLKVFYLGTLLLVMQSVSAQFFQFGPKAGINISNFNGGNFENVEKESLVGVHAGGFVRFRFGNTLAIQPEVVFSNQGAKLKTATESFDAKVSYLNIPVLLQLYSSGGFFVEGGPQVGFKVNEDVPNQTIEDFAKGSDFSICLGLGYQNRSGLGINGRYNIGVSKVGDFESSNIDPDFKNGVIQISLFYAFFNNAKK